MSKLFRLALFAIVFLPPLPVPRVDISDLSPLPTTIVTEDNTIKIKNGEDNVQGFINLKPTDSQVVFDPQIFSSDVKEWLITFPSDKNDIVLNFGSFLKKDSVSIPKRIIVNKPLSNTTITVVFPENTLMTSADWNGVIEGPIAISSSQTSCKTDNNIDLALEIGRKTIPVYFNKPIEIIVPNKAGHLFGYCVGDKLTIISKRCANPTSVECFVNRGNNLVIRTNHFTQFLIFSNSSQLLLWVLVTITLAISLIFIYGMLELITTQEVYAEKTDDHTKQLSTVAHELKTPLTAIQGFSHLILGGNYGHVDNKLKKPLHHIISSSNSLLSMIDSTLNLSRMNEHRLKFNLAEFDLSALIHKITTELEPLAEEKKLELKNHVEKDIEVMADEDKVKQILINLIGNAIKFTDVGKVEVRTLLTKEKVNIFIEDTGQGISSHDQKKLFKRFQRIDTKKQHPGTGLGLYISQKIARRMNGDIWIEKSEPEKGTTFAISLPLAKKQKN